MSEAARWLETRIADAPAPLRARMLNALVATDTDDDVATQLAQAAMTCLSASLHNTNERACAHDLLAADALLTHACEAAAEQGSDALIRFAESWDASRFDALLGAATE